VINNTIIITINIISITKTIIIFIIIIIIIIIIITAITFKKYTENIFHKIKYSLRN